MNAKKQELYNIIDTLPDELLTKVIDYIEYLKFTEITKQAPESVIVKDEDDLKEKLEEGIKDFESENVCSLEEAYLEVEKILAD